jgi:lysozyme
MDIFDQLRRDEKEVLHAYQDSLGYWTIGVGRLIDKRKGGGISPAESDFLLHNDVDAVTTSLKEYLPWFAALDTVRQAVLVNMGFNLGIVGLLTFHNSLSLMEKGDWNGAAAEILKSRWAAEVGERADRLAEQLRSGQWC